MKKLIFIMFAAIAANVSAEPTIKTGYGFCLQEQDLDKFISADSRMFDHLVDSGRCGVVAKSFPYSVIESGWFTANVRIWIGEDFLDVWVPVEALAK